MPRAPVCQCTPRRKQHMAAPRLAVGGRVLPLALLLVAAALSAPATRPAPAPSIAAPATAPASPAPAPAPAATHPAPATLAKLMSGEVATVKTRTNALVGGLDKYETKLEAAQEAQKVAVAEAISVDVERHSGHMAAAFKHHTEEGPATATRRPSPQDEIAALQHEVEMGNIRGRGSGAMPMPRARPCSRWPRPASWRRKRS